eukprot:5559359-Prymnesium_polylepis.2
MPSAASWGWPKTRSSREPWNFWLTTAGISPYSVVGAVALRALGSPWICRRCWPIRASRSSMEVMREPRPLLRELLPFSSVDTPPSSSCTSELFLVRCSCSPACASQLLTRLRWQWPRHRQNALQRKAARMELITVSAVTHATPHMLVPTASGALGGNGGAKGSSVLGGKKGGGGEDGPGGGGIGGGGGSVQHETHAFVSLQASNAVTWGTWIHVKLANTEHSTVDDCVVQWVAQESTYDCLTTHVM